MRALGQIQLIDRLVEVDFGRGLNAVGKVAVVVGVEIPLQNLIFRIAAAHFHGQQGFAQLAQITFDAFARRALFGFDQRVLHDLLRDRRAALHLSALQIAHQRAPHAAQIEARVFVEAAVFVGDGRLAAEFGNLIERHPLAIAGALVDHFVQQVLPRPIVNLGRLEEVLILIGELRFDLGGIGQIGGKAEIGRHRAADGEAEEQPDRDDDADQANAAIARMNVWPLPCLARCRCRRLTMICKRGSLFKTCYLLLF